MNTGTINLMKGESFNIRRFNIFSVKGMHPLPPDGWTNRHTETGKQTDRQTGGPMFGHVHKHTRSTHTYRIKTKHTHKYKHVILRFIDNSSNN